MNKKLVLVAMVSIATTLLFTAEVALAWWSSSSYRTSSGWGRCLGIRCDRTERIVFRRAALSTPSLGFSYGWDWSWGRQPTTCYQIGWE